jgi:hypothetical protein
MIKVTEKDWEIFNKNSGITKDELFKIFPYKAKFEELKQLLLQTKRDCFYNEEFYNILWRFPISMSDSEYIELLHFFLLEDWHHDHERILQELQNYSNEDKNSIKYLMKLLSHPPDRYQHDEYIKYPFIRKIIYAIGAQPEPYNIQALETLLQTEDKEIKELVLHQIEKRKRFGRWEAEDDE